MNIKSTTNFIKELTILSLASKGWDTHFENGYVFASKDGEPKDLIVCCSARCLSQGKFTETKLINATFGKVDKMLDYLNTIDDDCIPCIAFGIIKYSIDDFELAIIPVKAIKDFAKKGSVYSITESGGYYYNYSKLEDNELPRDAILRQQWSKK